MGLLGFAKVGWGSLGSLGLVRTQRTLANPSEPQQTYSSSFSPFGCARSYTSFSRSMVLCMYTWVAARLE
jgi:hypothetical protein